MHEEFYGLKWDYSCAQGGEFTEISAGSGPVCIISQRCGLSLKAGFFGGNLLSISTHPTNLCSHQHAEAVEPVVIGLQGVGFGNISSALKEKRPYINPH